MGEDRHIGVNRLDPDDAIDGGAGSRCFFLVAVAPTADATRADGDEPQLECRAFPDPLMVSDRQRDLVCRTRVHMTCARYLRANAVVAEAQEQAVPSTGRRLWKAFDVALVVALATIGLVAVLAFGSSMFGGQVATNRTATPPVATSSPPLSTPSGSPVASGTGSASPRSSHSPSPTRPPSKPTASWPPGATASRMNLVKPCPGQAGCYLYTVRPQETLRGIATFFGVTVDSILAMNPSIANPDHVEAGQTIRIPPPTR